MIRLEKLVSQPSDSGIGKDVLGEKQEVAKANSGQALVSLLGRT